MTPTTALPNEREVARWDREHRQECQERSCTLPHRMLAFADWYIVIAAEAERGWKAEARADLLARLKAEVGSGDESTGLPHWHYARDGRDSADEVAGVFVDRAAVLAILDRVAQP